MKKYPYMNYHLSLSFYKIKHLQYGAEIQKIKFVSCCFVEVKKQ